MSKFSDYLDNQQNETWWEHPVYDTRGKEPVYDDDRDSAPGFFSSLFHNALGGLEGSVGGGLDYLGAFAKSQGEINPDTWWNGLGDWLINNGNYLNNQADSIQQQYGTLNSYQDETLGQRLTDLDYLTDSRGLTADIFNGLGSSIPFIAASTLAPEIGVGGALARGAGGVLERMGARRLGQAVASDLVQAGANDFARYAATSGPLEAAVNAGGIYDDLKNQGLSDSEIFGKMNSMIGEELPMDMLTSGLYGAVLGGNTFSRLGQGGWKRAIAANVLNTPADMLGEYMQEMTQQQLQNKYSGKPYGTFWNPTEDEMQAGRAAAMGTLPMGMFGSARGVRNSRRAAMAAADGGSVTGPEPVTPPAVPDPNVDPVAAAQLTGKNDDVPTADGVDVTNLDPQQYTQWYGEKLKAQGIDVPDATITVQTPKATGTTGGAKAGAGANVMDAAQDFMGQHMENGANGCVEAVTKIGARYNPFLADELSKGVVNVDTLVADAGDKVIPFDPNNLEAGDVIVYDNNDHVVLYDGNGGYVGNSSSQQKVVQGGDYNNMGGLKPTKIIKTGNGVTAQNTQERADNGSAPAADLSSLPVGDIATSIAQNTGLPANFIWAQLSHESDGGNSKLAREDHNYGGVKGTDGEYLHFDNDQQFVDYMSNYYPKYREDGIYDAQTADQFAEALQHGGYFTADLGEYEGGMHRYLEQAGLSDSGTAGTPSEKQSGGDNANTMTQQQFGDMLNEKMIDFAGTNDDTVKAVFNDMSTSKDKALVALFAPYMQDGAFANTAANREALVGNDGFKKAMSMFLSKHLSDYAPAFENGRISFQQAEDALRPRHQVQAAQAVQTPNIQTAATPQALIQMVQKGLNREQQGAILQAANTALHTPQGMANGDEAVWMNKLAKAIDEHDYPTIAQMIPNESMQALSASKQTQPSVKANEPTKNPVSSTVPANTSVQQAPEAQQANVTPLPTQEAQQSEGVRIAQPQQTVDEQNAQMDARIAEIKKQPLAQRKELGQQYLDTLRQNNVSFSEKKLAKPLMDGEPEALEHVQRTYGDLLNTITPAEAAAASQHTAPRTIQAATMARLANMVSEITSGNTYKNASPVGKLAYLAAASGHAKTVGADESVKAIDSIIADVRKKAGFSGKGTTEGMTPEQKDEFYNTFYKQSLDDATAIRKEAKDEKPANLKILDNTIEMFKQELANSKPTKKERKEVTHESTQSKNQQKPDEGAKNQDQHAKPEPRKAAGTQRKAEEGEVSDNKKAADEGGQAVVTKKEQKADIKNLDSAKVPAMGEPIHGIKGAETTVVTDSGKEIRVRYRAVPASRVITSHDAETMVPNKAYPQELQPRDRQRVSMQEQVTAMANELRPADLGAGRNLNQGTPIIRKDGVVLNGNGRAMAIQKATAAGGDKATAYRKYIFEHSKEFGLSRSSLAQLRKYMLVREVVDDIDADTMQDIIGSTAGGSRMGASEQAKADAKKIKPRDLDSYVDNEQGDLTTAANQNFVANILYRIVGKNERNAYTDEHGNVNADGIQRVKRALFSLAYNDDGLIDKMAESTDDNIRNVSRGLMSAAPAFARVNLAVKDGQAYEYDAGKTISDAVKHLDALRREGKPVKDYLNEQSMFSEYQDTDEVREVLRFFDENKRSGKRIGIFLNDMAKSILEQGSPNQTSLMDGGRATLGEIIKSAERVARDGTTAASLFDNVQEAPAEEKTKKTTDDKKDESIFGSVEDADKEMKRPKVLFLSATPFAHDKDVDYAEGYLFNYDDQPNTGAYNQGTPFDRFMVKHFGYRMRTNKLTRPDAEVDSRAMEVQFHDDLVNSGAMHGRQIDVDKDYDRGFILVDGGIGHKIDEGFKFLSDNHAAYGELQQALMKQFNKSQQKYLIESIKAREVIPLIQEYVKKGKKVVLFHQSMVEHKNIHPFQLKPSDGLAENAAVWAQWKAFKSARPDLVDLSLGNVPAPMETLRKELGGHAVFINGSVLKKDRAKNIEQFNDDNSGVNIIVCQQDAANAGISLHDTTGKHPRVLINIAMPERPSYAMQIEGRIYRVGNASNAVFRYLSTGTDIEKNMFASTIGGRAASVENLAVGNAARGLRESFRDLYQETMDGSWRRRLPGAEGEGTGGKEMDYAVTADLSEYDRAKSFYFAHQKRTAATKAQEGNDYFATPEPIGYKMVEWLGLKPGEKALEPSAGHGAISRWFPETTERTIVEPSGKLMPLAQMNTPGAKAVHGSFEDFNIVNKFDGIAMNPPYGTGGKTAIEHLKKAFKQLHDGGRVVAIIPEGPAADKRYSKMMEEISSEVVPIADIHLPAVAFSRAGTKIGTHIVVLDRYTGKAAHQAALDHFGGADDIDLRDIDDIKDLFDRMENMTLPERYDASNAHRVEPVPTPAVQLDEARVEGVPDETPNFTADEFEHTKTHEVKFRARPKSFLGENYRPIQKLAKAHGGYYSKFAKNSFLFEDEDERNAFLQEAEALLSDGKASAKGSAADMVKHIEFPAADTLTEREKAMQEFGQQMGVRVVFFDGPANLRGFYNKGITFINRSASKSPSWVFWHENLHWLRSNNPELYRQMVDYISGRQEFSPEQLQAYRDAIGRPELTDADTIEEMLADAMPDVHKRVDLFRKMGRENKSLIQRFFGWLRDTMAAFHNAFSQPKYGLSKTQAQAMRNALANIAEDLRDGEGRRIFRTRGADRKILTAQGEELSYPVPDDNTKYSADKRDKEPAGSPGRMRRALVKLGLSTEQLKNVELRQAKGKQLDDISGWDMLAKSVRQVARKSPAVQYIYRLGRKALDEQEHLRNFYAQEIRKFNQYVKNPKILEEVAQLLWEGDATGHAYTGDELQAMGVSVEAGRAYNLVRRVLADAYKRVNEARMQVKVRTEVIGRNDYREFIASHFLKPEDVLKAEMLRNGSMRVTYRGAKVYSKNEEVVSSEVYNRLRKDKDVYIKYADVNDDGTYTIGYTERVKPIHDLEGYMPHFFHHFMVYEKTTGDDGKEILVSLGSANSLKKATDLANQYAKANPKGQFVIRPHSFEYDEDYNNVVVGDKDYMKMMMQITKHTEMTLPEANAFLHDSVGVTKKGRHRFFGNAQHRKGAKGFDRDVQWALTHYLNASARYVAMEHFKPEAISFYERFFGDFNAEPKSNTARYIKNFINDMNGVPSYIEDELNKIVANIPFFGSRLNDAFEGRPALALSSSISWFNAVTKLGLGNFASAAINFMQFINIGTRLNSYAYANMGLKKALKPSDFDRRIIEESGVMDEVNLASDAGGYTQTRDYGRARKGLSKVKKGLDLAMIPFTKADSLMRKAAILGAYYQGVQEKGMKPEHEGEISRKAIEYAKDVNYDANFDYSTAAAPGAMRAGSVLTQQLFQFQKYPIMQFEFFWNNVVHAENNKQRARFLVPYLLMSGAVGAVPFGALINAVASSLVGAGGDDDNDLAEEIKAEMMKWAGTDPMKRRLVNTVLYGILANANINISERVGMSNAFSGEYYGNKPESSAGALLQLFGGPLVSTVYNVATQIGNHNPIETIKAVSPSLGNMLQAVVGETRTTHHRVGTVYEDMYSRVMHGLGFRSVDETNNSFVNSYLYKQQKQAQEDRKDAMDAYIRNPSSENRQRMTSLGVTDKTFKTYKENANKSSKERSQSEKKTKSKKPQTEAQKESSRLKDFTK